MKYTNSGMGGCWIKSGKNNYRTHPQKKLGTTLIILLKLTFKYYEL